MNIDGPGYISCEETLGFEAVFSNGKIRVDLAMRVQVRPGLQIRNSAEGSGVTQLECITALRGTRVRV